MRTPAIKLSRRASALALAGVTALTMGADIAVVAAGANGVAGIGGHGRDVAAERAYLAQLRPAAQAVRLAVAPTELVLESITAGGDSFAARDAFAHGGGEKAIASAQRKLNKLSAPHSLAARQTRLVRAANRIASALHQLRGLRNVSNGTRLTSRIDIIGDQRLAAAEVAWDTALEASYKTDHLKAPADFKAHKLHASPSGTQWIFGADRSCSAASYKLVDLAKIKVLHSLSAAEQWDRLWARALTFVNHRIAGLRRPQGAAALPRLLTARLHVLTVNSRLLNHQISGFKSLSLPTVIKTSDKIKSLMPSLRSLAREMGAYGAHTCGTVMAQWAGKGANSHHHANLNT